MDSPEACRVQRFRRTSSSRDSFNIPTYVRTVPSALVEALTAPREKFERYHRSSLTDGSKGPRETSQKVNQGTQTNPIASDSKAAQFSGSISDCEAVAPLGSKAVTAPPRDATTPEGEEVPMRTTESSAKPSTNITEERSEVEEAKTNDNITRCIPYDPEGTVLAMQRLRDVKHRCPAKIANCLQKINKEIAEKLTNAGEALSASPSTSLSSVTVSGPDGRQRTGPPAPLAALPEPWEDRLDAPIAVSNTLGRKRGLFGDVERKELHHHVISILNRVAGDATKYREVKNELLRLPIPEASDEMLKNIVNVFFMKAVREQHFANLYADLVVELCKVPEGQRIVGNKSQSLEFRMRQQLLSRCQEEFQRLEEKNIETANQGGEDRNTQSADESFKERRDRACGIVAFVGQLFLRHIVTEKVIMQILTTTTAGHYGREGLVMPPPYTPSEGQMDELVKLLGIVDSAFFATPLGSSMLVVFTDIMVHWSQHHPVLRIRLLLLSVVERLQKKIGEQNAAAQQQRQQQQQQPPGQTRQSAFEGKRPPNSVGDSQRPVSPSSGGNSPLSVSGVPAAVSVAGVEVAARPIQPPPAARNSLIPAPRSAASRQSSIVVTTPLTSTVSTSFAVKQVATTETVATYMHNVTRCDCTVDMVVDEIANAFENVISVVVVWTERCLTVVKTAKQRVLFGPFLCSVERQCGGTLKEKLRQVAMDAFRNAVRQKLYEDLAIFKYWTEMICSDTAREVLDETLLNEGLDCVMSFDRSAVRIYLRDVAMQLQQRSSDPQREPSLEKNDFIRYRPLQVIHANTAESGVEPILALIDYPDVRKQSIEIDLYCTIVTDNPPKNVLFDSLASSPCLESPLAAAEVFSALLHAWLKSGFANSIQDHVDICLLAVNNRDRATREILLLMELYSVLKNVVPPSTRSIEMGEIALKVLKKGLVTEETRVRAYNYLEPLERNPHHFIGIPPGSIARSEFESSKPGISTLKERKSHSGNGSSGAVRRV